MAKIILFELNEVPWRVVEDYIADHPGSTIARLAKHAGRFETHASDTSLSPWITWPTLHRGVTDEDHTISDFNQDLSEIDRAFPPIWQLLASQGVPTGVFGSLHSYPLPSDLNNYDFFVPDVFASGSECFPQKMETFQDFNLTMSRASARNVSSKVPWNKALKLLSSAPGLGLKPKTLLNVGLQMLDERRRRWVKARRRTHQVLLAFDVFFKQLRQAKPSFATFFTNHVASSMHRYWAAKYPRDYQHFGYDDAWVKTFCNEITWVMHRADAMLSRLVKFVERERDYTLWIASSMGQAATEANLVLKQVYLKNMPKLMEFLGFAADEWETRPAMLPRVIVKVRESLAARFEQSLATIQVSDRGPLPWKQLSAGIYRIHPGALQNVADETCLVGDRVVPFEALGFSNEPIEDASGSNAYHIPHGTMLIYNPSAITAKQPRVEISTCEVAPMILQTLNVTRPSYMHRPVAGVSASKAA